MLPTVMALYNAAGPFTLLLCGRRTEEVRKKLAVLLAAAMMVVLAASPAWAAPGGNLNGNGRGVGGGNAINADNGNHTATGGGTLNIGHLCDVGCT
jgi:hypothetical protein